MNIDVVRNKKGAGLHELASVQNLALPVQETRKRPATSAGTEYFPEAENDPLAKH